MITPLIGCDPEVFVFDKNTGEHICAANLVKGTKENPQEIKDGMVQVDGMALEFGIEPAKNEEEFVSKIKSVLNQLAAMLPKNLCLDFKSTVVFSNEVFKSAPKESLELGCDPDYNSYTGLENPRPKPINAQLRSAGGHIHVGWCKNMAPNNIDHFNACRVLAAAMDQYLGVPSLYWDKDAVRRTLYGAAGAFRPKTYGMEYRTLSNQWLIKEEYIRYVYRQTIGAFNSIQENRISFEKKSYFYGQLKLVERDVINRGLTLIGKEHYLKNV